jgi:predicted metal-dependent HD superfamily phosphohydrolase
VLAGNRNLQLARFVDARDVEGLFAEVGKIYSASFPGSPTAPLERALERTRQLFEGRFPGYRACTAEYHDLRHTLSVVLAVARLADGYDLERPPLAERLFLDLLLATCLHDTGYIQESWDTKGTGAKYAAHHEERSIAFMERHQAEFGIPSEELPVLARFIRATDLKQPFLQLPFREPQERDAAALLATADLLGQMSDRDYLEKLLFLYYEFKEAGVPGFQTEYDVLRKTGDFYVLARKRLKAGYLSMYALARAHFRERYGVDANLYMIAISRQLRYLRGIIRDETTNFRAKLKRGDVRRRELLSQRPGPAAGAVSR